MWYWIPSIAAAVLVAFWIQAHRRFLGHWRRLGKVLDALGEGREPGSYVFLNGGRFEEISPRLQKLAQEQARLRKLAEDERFNLRTILASMEEGVMVVDSRLRLQRANPSFFHLFRLHDTPVGHSILDALPVPEFEEMVLAALETADPQVREVALTEANPPRQIYVHAVPLRDSSGQLAVLAIFRDITRLKQLEEVRREFVANVSHELRTPLSIFHGYVETLLDNPSMPRKEISGIFQVLDRHSQRLNALVEDLLVLARLESRREVIRFENVDLHESINAIAMDWAVKMAAKGVTLDVTVAADVPVIRADPLRLDQIFSNLLDNALKYTPAGGCIAIQAACEGDQVVLCVEDNGAGIPPQDLPHIFERFYRADKARSREMGGTGLGLSIVKHIAQAHGGSAEAQSTLGKGAAIIVKLPVEAREPSSLEG